jgi:uncharacterized protein (TIGR00645 family)
MRITSKFLDGLIFNARWILYPVHITLMVASVMYCLLMLKQAGLIVYYGGDYLLGWRSSKDVIVAVVRLIEFAMTEWLLVSTIMGGHQIYICRFKRTNLPQWLEHIDAVTMKVKVGLAFVGYSSAQLLEDMITHVPMELWLRDIVTHIVFLLTALCAATVFRLLTAKSA